MILFFIAFEEDDTYYIGLAVQGVYPQTKMRFAKKDCKLSNKTVTLSNKT